MTTTSKGSVDADLEAHAGRGAPLLERQVPVLRLSRFDDVLGAMLYVETFSSAHATTIELMTDEPQTVPDDDLMDPPEHTWHRKGQPGVSPPGPSTGSSPVSSACAPACSTARRRGAFDFVEDSAQIPPRMILALLDSPRARRRMAGGDRPDVHHEQGEAGFRQRPSPRKRGPHRQSGAIARACCTMLPELMEQRRKEPVDDLISTLVHTEIDGGMAARVS